MNISNVNRILILIFCISTYAYADEENTTSNGWWGYLTYDISSAFPWNWYSNIMEYVSPTEIYTEKTQIENDENNIDIANEKETSEATPTSFHEFMKEINAEIASNGRTNSQKILWALKSVKNAFLNKKLYTYVAVGGKKLLVNLGMFHTEERTKNMEEATNLLTSFWNFLMKIVKALFFWIPGIDPAVESATESVHNTIKKTIPTSEKSKLEDDNMKNKSKEGQKEKNKDQKEKKEESQKENKKENQLESLSDEKWQKLLNEFSAKMDELEKLILSYKKYQDENKLDTPEVAENARKIHQVIKELESMDAVVGKEKMNEILAGIKKEIATLKPPIKGNTKDGQIKSEADCDGDNCKMPKT